MTSNDFLTVADISRRLGCSTRAVYAAIGRGDLKAAIINDRGDYRIRSDWFSAFIESRSLTATDAFIARGGKL
jgi:excisionase family DNA binding protein